MDPANATVAVGETVSFTCSFPGPQPPLQVSLSVAVYICVILYSPLSQIDWFIYGESNSPLTLPKYLINISDDGLSSQLSFEASLEDHGSGYYCQATAEGEVLLIDTQPAFLTVNCEHTTHITSVVGAIQSFNDSKSANRIWKFPLFGFSSSYSY